MLNRRTLLLSTTAVLASLALETRAARAQSADQALTFIDRTMKELATAVNGPGSSAEKQAKLQAIVDRTVDVSGVAQFCLGRFWRIATPEQKRDYLALFHRVLMINITGKVGEYQGVTFTLGRATPRETGGVMVASIVNRPGTAPSKVDWLVTNDTGSPKIVDVVAEGTSLRLTQRSDYASYLSRNNNNVQALIDAMRQQASQQG
jgi:phospholipid transport system substrate-binding protein